MNKKLLACLCLFSAVLFGCNKNNNCSSDAYIPVPPHDIKVAAGDRSLDIDWEDVDQADGYIVYIFQASAVSAYLADTEGFFAPVFMETDLNAVNAPSYGFVATVTKSGYSASGLINGLDYIVKVASKNRNGRSSLSAEFRGRPNVPSAAPGKTIGLAASSGDSRADLKWLKTPGASSYNVYIADSGSGSFSKLWSLTGTAYSATGLTNGKTYNFIIKAVNAAGEGPSSDIAEAKPVEISAPPVPPSSLGTYPGDMFVNLIWPASSGALGYTVYQSFSETGTYFPVGTINDLNYRAINLQNGVTYWFKVAAVNEAGTGDMGPAASAVPALAVNIPSGVGGLRATGGNGKVDLSWNIVPEASGYNIYKAFSEGGPYNLYAGNIDALSYSVSGLDNGNTYWFKVAAVNSAGEGDKGSAAAASAVAPVIPPVPPAAVNATSGNASAVISWDCVAGASSYTVYVGPSASGPFTQSATVSGSPYTVTGLSNGRPYWFAVGANNTAGNGERSELVRVVPAVPVTIPLIPIGLSVSAGNSSAFLSWNSSSSAVSYNIYQSLSESGVYSKIQSSAGTSASINGLTNGISYMFKVTGVNEAGESKLSQAASVTPQAPVVPPAAPGGVSASAGNSSAIISWQSVANADIYDIYLSDSQDGPYADIASSASSPVTLGSLANGQKYWFKVSAKNSAGQGALSSAVSVIPQAPLLAPLPPAFISAVPGDGYVDLSWPPSAGAMTYFIYQSLSSGAYSQVMQSAVNTGRVIGLTNGVQYLFKVTAANSAGESERSVAVTVTPEAPAVKPNPPAGLNATAANSSVNLSWAFVVNADNYIVYKSSDNQSFEAVATVNLPSYTVGGLANGNEYWFKVSAKNAAGEGEATSSVSVTPKAPVVVPAAPLILSAIADNAQVTLTWSPVIGADNYTVYVSSDGGSAYPVKISSADTSEVVTGLANGVTYFFRISATNGAGEGSQSLAASATPVAAVAVPATPVGLSAISGDKSVSLVWSLSPGAQNYNVYQSSAQNGTYNKIKNVSALLTTVEGLANSQTYWFKVSAANSAGESPLSGAVSAIPAPPVLVPWVPTGFASSPADSRITLSWNSVAGASSYNIYSTDAAGSSYTLKGSTPDANYAVTGLTNGTLYYYAVSAVNVAGESGKSIIVSAMPLSDVIPTPSNLRASSGLLGLVGVKVSWDGVTWDGGSSKPDSYSIYMSSNGQNGAYTLKATVDGNTDSYQISTGLTLLSTYWFKVKTNKGGKSSDFSHPASATVILGL